MPLPTFYKGAIQPIWPTVLSEPLLIAVLYSLFPYPKLHSEYMHSEKDLVEN